MRTLASASLLCVSLTLATTSACSRDDRAPDCFVENDEGECTELLPGSDLKIDCSVLPDGVARALYEFELPQPVLPESNGVDWQADGLPDGLTIDQDGVLTGNIAAPGIYTDIEITVRDERRNVSETSRCGPLRITDPLVVDTSPTVRGCVSPDDDLMELISGGTGEALTCELPQLSGGGDLCPLGRGNGRFPSGLTIESDCRVTGEIDDSVEHDGTFVWMVKVQQSGAELFVPFCAEHAKAGEHRVQILSDGSDLDPLQPMHIEYRNSQPVAYGSDGDPYFRVTANDSCTGGLCSAYNVKLFGTCSPFDASLAGSLDPVGGVKDGVGEDVGLSHQLILNSGSLSVEEYGLSDRPWILNLRNTYCTSQSGVVDKCTAPSSRVTHFTWSVIAWPEGQSPG